MASDLRRLHGNRYRFFLIRGVLDETVISHHGWDQLRLCHYAWELSVGYRGWRWHWRVPSSRTVSFKTISRFRSIAYDFGHCDHLPLAKLVDPSRGAPTLVQGALRLLRSFPLGSLFGCDLSSRCPQRERRAITGACC